MLISEVFLRVMMFWFMNDGIMMWNVCGSMIFCMVFQWFRFSECDVFVWLGLIVWILLWMIFVMYVLVFSDRVIVLVMNGLNLRLGISCGIVKNMKKVWIRIGVLWKMQMQVVVIQWNGVILEMCLNLKMMLRMNVVIIVMIVVRMVSYRFCMSVGQQVIVMEMMLVGCVFCVLLFDVRYVFMILLYLLEFCRLVRLVLNIFRSLVFLFLLIVKLYLLLSVGLLMSWKFDFCWMLQVSIGKFLKQLMV